MWDYLVAWQTSLPESVAVMVKEAMTIKVGVASKDLEAKGVTDQMFQ